MPNLKYEIYDGDEYDDFIAMLEQPKIDLVVVGSYFGNLSIDQCFGDLYHLPYRYEMKTVLIIYPQFKDYSLKEFLDVVYENFNPSFDHRFSYVHTTTDSYYYKNYKENEVIEVITHGGFNRTYYITHKLEDLYDIDLRELESDETTTMGCNIIELKNKIANFNSEKYSHQRLVHNYQATLKPLEQLIDAMRFDLGKIDRLLSSKFKEGDIVRWGDRIFLVNDIVPFNTISDEFNKILGKPHESLSSPIKIEKDYSSFYLDSKEILKSGKISTKNGACLYYISALKVLGNVSDYNSDNLRKKLFYLKN